MMEIPRRTPEVFKHPHFTDWACGLGKDLFHSRGITRCHIRVVGSFFSKLRRYSQASDCVANSFLPASRPLSL